VDTSRFRVGAGDPRTRYGDEFNELGLPQNSLFPFSSEASVGRMARQMPRQWKPKWIGRCRNHARVIPPR
jgi:hypothetical protein